MKTKKRGGAPHKKRFALMGIVVVLCSMFLVATLPGVVADQKQETSKVSASEVTTASEDDFILEIYGNANEDECIDMRDYTYTARIICWLEEESTLADANYDGRISVADMTQIGLIILGRESELTIVDSADRIVTVDKPIERIVVHYMAPLEMMRTLNVPADKVVGVNRGTSLGIFSQYLPEYKGKPIVGEWGVGHDVEKILSLNPDLVFMDPTAYCDEFVAKLESTGVPTVRFWCGLGDINVVDEMRKFGYIFNNPEKAEEYINWYEAILDTIKERVEKIPEEDKPSVYFEMGVVPYLTGGEGITSIEFGGGKTIFPELTGREYAGVDPEGVIDQDPDIIVKTHTTYESILDTELGYGYGVDVGDIEELKAVSDEIISRPELQTVSAVKTGEVYAISAHILSYDSYSGGRAFLHKVYMAKWLQPELFENLDPKATHQEYLTRFQGLDVDLDEKGVFVYHQEKNPYGH